MRVVGRSIDVEDGAGFVVEHGAAAARGVVNLKVRQGSGIGCKAHCAVVVPNTAAAQRRGSGEARRDRCCNPRLRCQRPRAGNKRVGTAAPTEATARQYCYTA